MAYSNQLLGRIGRIAGVVAAVALLAGAGSVASAPSAQAQIVHRHGGPGFHPGFRGRFGYVGGPRFYRGWYGWPGYGYYGWPYLYGYVRYYYPQYYYPAYVLPRAAYVVPAPPPVAQAHARDFTVYFDFDKYNLTAAARRVVNAAIAAAKEGGPARVDVTGNTDLAGTNRYNLELSRRRAETVRNYMVAHGVDPGEIDIGARGKTDPIVRTADGVREPRNRRVEIVISPERSGPPATSMARPPMVPAHATMAAPPPPPQGAPPAPPPGAVGQPTNLINQ